MIVWRRKRTIAAICSGLGLCGSVMTDRPVCAQQVQVAPPDASTTAPAPQIPLPHVAPYHLEGDMLGQRAAAMAASSIPPQQARERIETLAGEYSYGNGFNLNCRLQISGDGQFVYQRCDCEEVVEQVAGVVSLGEDGHLRLNPVQARGKAGGMKDPVLVPVSWGQRLYLVPQKDMVGFLNQINRGAEPVQKGNVGQYFLREGDWDRPADGKPDLPPDLKQRILEKPLMGGVTGKDPRDRWVMNLGQNHGVYDGMELSAWAPDGSNFVTVKVTQTGVDSSAIKLLDSPENLSIQGWTVYSQLAPPQPQSSE